MTRFVSLPAIALTLTLSLTVRAANPQPVPVDQYQGKIRVACIGDSITQGVGAGGQPWVKQVGEALENRWELNNLGVSGATLLKKGDRPYDKLPQWKKAPELKPDVALIALGTNDSKPQNWKSADSFAGDYEDMIAQLKAANSKIRIYCLLPVPAYPANFGINDGTIKNEVLPRIREVAEKTGSQVIDLYGPMIDKASFVPDKVHPNADGHRVMAGAIYRALTGKELPDAK